MKISNKWTLALLMLSSIASFAGVSVSSPSDGATVNSPVQVTAYASADSGIAATRVYVDDQSAYLVYSGNVNTSLPMGNGSHHIVLVSWDNYGNVMSQGLMVNVGGNGGGGGGVSGSGITVNSPGNGQTVGSPVQFSASAVSPSRNPITAMQIYLDDQLQYTSNSNQLNTALNVGGGTHHAVFKSWDSSGAPFAVDEYFTVGNGGGSAPVPAPANGGVTITSPGSTSGSPMHVVGLASAPSGIVAMHVYLDDQDVFQTGGGNVDTWVNAGAGTHNLVVQAWDSNGTVYKQPMSVSVNGGGAPAPAPAPAPSGNGYYDIDQLGGWDSCNSCAGPGGVGPQVDYSLSQWQGSPSMDGQSAQFWLGGGYPYSGALWWKQLTPQPGASHFVYDLYFYYQDANAPQGLEFDVNQSVNGGKYIFGTECNLKETGTWRVWNTTASQWVNTGVGCNPSAYNWNHMTWEFQRNGDGSYTFVAVTLNGQKNYVNYSFWSKPQGGDELNVAVQLDSNYAATPYSVWVDKIALMYN